MNYLNFIGGILLIANVVWGLYGALLLVEGGFESTLDNITIFGKVMFVTLLLPANALFFFGTLFRALCIKKGYLEWVNTLGLMLTGKCPHIGAKLRVTQAWQYKQVNPTDKYKTRIDYKQGVMKCKHCYEEFGNVISIPETDPNYKTFVDKFYKKGD